MKCIAVCCLTRNRPLMLVAALESAVKLIAPEGFRLLFVCVENDTQDRSRHIVERIFADRAHEYALEPRPGIAIARNTAMRIALAKGADAIAFFDDDETVDANWIVELTQAMTAQGLHLVGGPVRVEFERHEGALSHIIARGIARKYRWREWKKWLMPWRASICTNNCLIRADVMTHHGIMFDERFKTSSDHRFHLDARAKGLKHGWASRAIVSELWPNERLSLGYYFERGRAQAKSSVLLSRHAGYGMAYLGLLVFWHTLVKLLNSLALLLISPLQFSASLVQITRNMGRMAGYMEGAFGHGQTTLYDQTTGS